MSFYKIIKYSYLQYVRTYTFLITICISLAIAYTFVPEPEASYSTIRVSSYIGFYNSAWFGYVTAIMTSVFLALIGFYLVNSAVKKDAKMGHIIASTSISNFGYLFSKVISNFLVLLTIVVAVFVMSICLFVMYNGGFSFEIEHFIMPYAIITIPTVFVIAAFAVCFEVFLGKYTTLLNIAFFFLFGFLLVTNFNDNNTYVSDIFGVKIVMDGIETEVKQLLDDSESINVSIGFTTNSIKNFKKFEFNGIDFPAVFLLSRIGWMFLGILLVFGVSKWFGRFRNKTHTKGSGIGEEVKVKPEVLKLNTNTLENLVSNTSIVPLIKTEILLLLKKGNKWLWLLNGVGILLLVILPIEVAHQFVLPILWFLQVTKISDVTIKELIHSTYYFSFSSHKPLSRLLFSQIVSCILWLLVFATPLILRYLINVSFDKVLTIILGAIFIVLFASLCGIVSKGKKMFEVIFFMITYANINGISFLDYFGGLQSSTFYISKLSVCIILFIVSVFILRKWQLTRMG